MEMLYEVTGRYRLDEFCNATKKRHNVDRESYRVGAIIFEGPTDGRPRTVARLAHVWGTALLPSLLFITLSLNIIVVSI